MGLILDDDAILCGLHLRSIIFCLLVLAGHTADGIGSAKEDRRNSYGKAYECMRASLLAESVSSVVCFRFVFYLVFV